MRKLILNANSRISKSLISGQFAIIARTVCVWKNKKFTFTEEIICEINFFRDNVIFTKFLSKKCGSKFPQFLHCDASLQDDRVLTNL